MRIPALGLLITVLFAAHLQGKEARDGKPVVYNEITTPNSPAEDVAMRKEYEKRFRIVDFRKDKTYIPPKEIKTPTYFTPQDASGRFVTGTVRVVFILTAEGRVIEPFILSSSNQLLNEPALKAIKHWQSTPGRLNGTPVAMLAGQEVRFEKPPAWMPAPSEVPAIDAKGIRHSLSDYPEHPWMDDVIKRVEPNYLRYSQGAGLFRCMIDLKTGIVSNVIVVKSIGNSMLDLRSVAAFRKWRWKPGTWQQVTIPVVLGNPDRPDGYSGQGEWRRAMPSYAPRGAEP